MSEPNPNVSKLESAKTAFVKSTSLLAEVDSGYTPQEGLFTAAQQVAHVAQTVDWFIEGAFEREGGCSSDFESAERAVREVESLGKAREWLDRAFAKAVKVIATKTEEDLAVPFGDEIMGDLPKGALVGGIVDHTAHHRGALTVYARLLGKTPPMPYM